MGSIAMLFNDMSELAVRVSKLDFSFGANCVAGCDA